MRGQAKVSIVILNRNGKAFIKDCLETVMNALYRNFEVIVIDNASTDGSYEIVEKLSYVDNRVKLKKNTENIGFAAGCNMGYEHSTGDYIIFLNNDTQVDPDWINGLIDAFSKDEHLIILQCNLLSLSNKEIIDRAGNFIDYLGYGYPIGIGQKIECYKSSYEIFYADGAALAIRKDLALNILLNQSELFDSSYFIYYEETDLCWRARLNGFKIAFIPNSIVYHYRTLSSFDRVKGHLVFLHARNRISTIVKNYELHNIIRFVPLLILFELIRALFLMRKRTSHGIAIMKAILWNFANLRSILIKRIYIQNKIRKADDSEVMRYMKPINLRHLWQGYRKYT